MKTNINDNVLSLKPHQPPHVKFIYLRKTKNENPRAVVAYSIVNNNLYYATSVLNKKDVFIKAKGREIAKGRLLNALEEGTINGERVSPIKLTDKDFEQCPTAIVVLESLRVAENSGHSCPNLIRRLAKQMLDGYKSEEPIPASAA